MLQFKILHFRGQHLSILLASAFLITCTLYFLVIGIDSDLFAHANPWIDREKLVSQHGSTHVGLVPCVGPRGKLLNESADDQISPRTLDLSYPRPLGGSYEALSLHQNWMTADARYGPYGYRDDATRSHVDWDSVNWGALQDDCLAQNQMRFNLSTKALHHPRISMPSWLSRLKSKWSASNKHPTSTGTTAIVLRTWDSYSYKKEDMVFLRSLIVETSLSSGGKYSVFLLVHVKDRSKAIFSSAANYQAVLQDAVPPELQSIAVLFDESLLEKWYPKVHDHSPYNQMLQPLQLFSQFYRDFDHYWQLEMDMRFTGDSLHYLEAVSAFARQEPRKQSVERASFRYMPEIHGTYQEFLSAVNSSVQGRGIWGALRVPEIQPVGPTPPHPDPIDDDFRWGVGSDADFVAMVPCKSLPLTTTWPFQDWIFGFADKSQTPRLFCPQAVSRSSRDLLDAVHAAQKDRGLTVPSEATMASFALWHGLKISHPPHPWFVDPAQDAHAMDEIINGGPPRSNCSGFAFGTNSYDADVLYDFNWHTQQSWWWRSDLPQRVMDLWWAGSDSSVSDDTELPDLLRRHDGQVYLANVALHPYKTNPN